MQIGTLVKTKNNFMTARINLPTGYGIITRGFKKMENNTIVYVQYPDEPKARPVNTVYLEVICK